MLSANYSALDVNLLQERWRRRVSVVIAFILFPDRMDEELKPPEQAGSLLLQAAASMYAFSFGQGIVFHIEIAQAQGLPKPEVAFIQIAGLGLQEDGGEGCGIMACSS